MSTTHDEKVADQFGPQAAAYVSSAVHAAGQDLVRVSEIAAGRRPRLALDLGCGGGHVTYSIAPHAQSVVAVDLSESMLSAVHSQAEARGLRNVEVQVASAESLPFGSETFDLIACRFSAHHWQDWEAGLREAARVSSPDGALIFIDILAPASPVLDTHLQSIEVLRDPSHVRDYRLSEWIAALERAGLAIDSVATHRLRLEFRSWTERMMTPEAMANAIRELQQGASAPIRAAFGIEADGSFTTDVALIVAAHAAGRAGRDRSA